MRFLLIPLTLALAACSSPAPQTKQAPPDPNAPVASAANAKHPLAKYIELAGFRLSEASPGKMNVKFTAINHSDADLGDLTVKIHMFTTAAKPADPPVAEFDAKIPSLGPQETKDIMATVETKMRVYELPDWQFLRATFDITSPAP